MKPFQVFERVYQIGGPDITSASDCCIYLINGGSELAVIDTGIGKSVSKLIKNIEQLGFDTAAVNYLVATHGHIDHIGGLAYLKETLNAGVLAHELELPAIEGRNIGCTAAGVYGVSYEPVDVDIVISGNEGFIKIGDLKLICPHTPGHTPGGLSPYLDHKGKRVLFGQDIHGPFNPAWGSDVAAWKQSLRKLLSLEADFLCEGHFGIYKTKEKVRKYIESYLD